MRKSWELRPRRLVTPRRTRAYPSRTLSDANATCALRALRHAWDRPRCRLPASEKPTTGARRTPHPTASAYRLAHPPLVKSASLSLATRQLGPAPFESELATQPRAGGYWKSLGPPGPRVCLCVANSGTRTGSRARLSRVRTGSIREVSRPADRLDRSGRH